MRVAVLVGAGRVEVIERPAPRPGPGEVIVDITSVGVCGSDVASFEQAVDVPRVLGHEAAGVVRALGEGVPGLHLGRRVSLEPVMPDLTCRQCLSGRPNLCTSARPLTGALAEQLAVHHSVVHPVPDTLSDDAAALLEPVSVGIWACRKGRVRPGSRVLVTGAGPVGLVAAQVALASGATQVVVADPNPRRLQLARVLGATDVVDMGGTALCDADPPDVVLECSGRPATIAAAVGVLAPAGRAVLVGEGGDGALLPVTTIRERELTIVGATRYAGTWSAAIELVASGRVKVDALVTGHYALDETGAALTAQHRDPGALKVMVLPAG